MLPRLLAEGGASRWGWGVVTVKTRARYTCAVTGPFRFTSALQVCGLQQGHTYVFRVRAVNASGVGKPSDASEPVLLEARPGGCAARWA